MAEKVLMLALSPTMEEGTIVNWKVKPGDEIAENQVLCEVETDKTTMEYESQLEGTLLHIAVQAGQAVRVGEAIAIIGQAGEDISSLLSSLSSAAPAETTPRPAPADSAPAAPIAAPAIPPAQAGSDSGAAPASPLARKLASDAGISLQGVQGSGPGGRIVKRDIESALAGNSSLPVQSAQGPAAASPRLEDKRIPLSDKRRVIAQRLSESMYTAPHYYLSVSIELDTVLAARQRLNQGLKDRKVSMNAFFIKIAAEALKRHPLVNSSWKGDHILQHGSVDIALAVAQPDGLITPLVRGCESKGILQIDEEMNSLIKKAFENKLKPEEYSGASFTISNLGSFGIDEFTAIINPPGSAILAIGKAQKEAVVNDQDQIEIRTRMKVNLSCDHRVIDGAVGAAFLADLKALMEDPIRALV